MVLLDDLQEIEKRLDAEGDTKAVRRAFWRIISKMKRQPRAGVSESEIVKATEIRNRLFRHPVVMGVGKGVFLFLLCLVLALLAYIWVLMYLVVDFLWLNVILLVVSIFVLYGAYPIGRYFGGKIARVQFDGFYRYSPGELGLKIEYSSYLRTTLRRRKWVFGFPVIWIFGFLAVEVILAWFLNPAGVWGAFIILVLFPVFYVAIYFRRTGELYRFIRELRIEREVKRRSVY
ncbi:MAG: hypothetical protein ACFFCO_08185 [Promethearchaeota archaeon]